MDLWFNNSVQQQFIEWILCARPFITDKVPDQCLVCLRHNSQLGAKKAVPGRHEIDWGRCFNRLQSPTTRQPDPVDLW